jgi:hypothetical protein
MYSQIILILDPHKVITVQELELAPSTAMWIAQSDDNKGLIASLNKAASQPWQITSFKVRPSETLVDRLNRILPSLDEHYSEVSQAKPYSELVIIDAPENMNSIQLFQEFGFKSINWVGRNLVVRKISTTTATA